MEYFRAEGRVDTMENQVMNSDERFIDRVTKDSPECKRILDKIVENKKTTKSKKKEIAAIAIDILESGAAKIDEDSEVTYGEVLTAKALANTLNKEDLNVRDLQDIQRVTGETTEKDSGVVINLITGGQDLGD